MNLTDQALRLAAVLALSFPPVRLEAGDANAGPRAENRSVATRCAEHDNVSIPLVLPGRDVSLVAFAIEARHPSYSFDEDHGEEDFTNCPPPTHPDTLFASPGTFLMHDDGETAIIAVRLERWWRPRGMTAGGPRGQFTDAHYIALHRRVDGHYPQVLVLYSDGNLRLKPFPPEGRVDTLFGSSIVLGPVRISDRPFASLSSIEYRPESRSFDIVFDSGESAILSLESVNRRRTRVRVEVDYTTPQDAAFATFRSMYVSEGNCDVDHVTWESSDQVRDSAIMAFSGALAEEFLFSRQIISRHNVSAPDIWIGDFELEEEERDFHRGDVDLNGRMEVTDAIAALGILFSDGRAPACADALDADDNGALNLADVMFILHALFHGGPLPPPPFGGCGPDPTPDLLDCAVRTACSAR